MSYPYKGMPLTGEIIVTLLKDYNILNPGNHTSGSIRQIVIAAHQQLGGIEYKGRTDIVTTFEGAFRKLQELNVMKKNPIRGFHTLIDTKGSKITLEIKLDTNSENSSIEFESFIPNETYGEGEGSVYLWTFKEWLVNATSKNMSYFPCKLGKTTKKIVSQRIKEYLGSEIDKQLIPSNPEVVLHVIVKDDDIDNLERTLLRIYGEWQRKMSPWDARFGKEWVLTNMDEFVSLIKTLRPDNFYSSVDFPSNDELDTFIKSLPYSEENPSNE
jgi:hypothetical protein